jgi:hypothetical protein
MCCSVHEYPHLGVGDNGKTLQRALMFYGRYKRCCFMHHIHILMLSHGHDEEVQVDFPFLPLVSEICLYVPHVVGKDPKAVVDDLILLCLTLLLMSSMLF